ncbi:MAG: nicotinate-nucleotide--dimethylbenzimidazole phosphoribosyltransferase [Oscillospiraceae bacterium]|nr:nicotinate-nucleotide--dimethylbenzimidazole phosphoribosyltransferase [Oscillospiraceae bacterium]
MDRISQIKCPDNEIFLAAKARWDSVAKPLGSLGLLEEAVQKIAAIQKSTDVDLSRRKVVVMCADNGVTAEKVTQSDSSVTAVCAKAIADGTSNINKLAKVFGVSVTAVDIGVEREINSHKILNRKIAYGTKNIAVGAAMTKEQAEKSICVGIDIMRDLKNEGVNIVVTGEMGIGNTTTSAAIASVLLDVQPRVVAGRGAGLDSAGLERKIAVIERAIAKNAPNANDSIELISKLGGFDIGGMTGLFLGGAIYGVPVIIDGVISAVSALLAKKINPVSAEYMLASHVSSEPAGKMLLEKIGLKPIINAEMRLGEGTGGIMLLPLLDGALAIYKHSHKFDEIGIERYVELK